MIFKLYDCDFGVTLNGVNYDFTHVEDLTIEDPERTRLVRGANAKDETGIDYKEGIKDAKVVTVTVIGLPVELHNRLREAYKARERMDCYCISRTDGSSKIAKNAILSMEPAQMNLSDSPDSMNVSLVFESFNITEKHKS